MSSGLLVLLAVIASCSALRLNAPVGKFKKVDDLVTVTLDDSDELSAKKSLAEHASSEKSGIVLLGTPGRAYDRVSDAFLSAYPEYEEVVINDGEYRGKLSFHRRSKSTPEFGRWFRNRHQFAFPSEPAECDSLPEGVQMMKVGNFIGSQANVGMMALVASRSPLINVLDSDDYGVYNRKPTNATALSKELNSCTGEENSKGCMFLRNADCLVDEAQIGKAKNGHEMAGADPEGFDVKELCQSAGRGLSEDECAQVLAARYPHPPALDGSVDYTINPFLTELALTSYTRVGAPVRRAIRKKVEDFLAESGFHSQEPCVAMHVRTGDKVPECEVEKKMSSCSFLEALPKYVPKAQEMLEQVGGESGKGSIFVLTDNSTMIQTFKDDNPHLRIYGMGGNSPGAPWADSQEELVTILASLELASKCNAFVGNSESEMSELAIMFMCRAKGQCPAAFSFQNGEEGSAEAAVNGSPLAPYGILQRLKA